MTNRFARVSTWFAAALTAVMLAGAQGCGGNEPLAPAHSSSFFPVHGTNDAGAAAGALHWVYRVNDGQPVVATADPTVMFRFSDEDVTAQDGLTIRTLINADVAGTGVSGHETVDQTDHLTSGSSPATISERDVNLTLTLAAMGIQEGLKEMLKSDFGTTPLATFFDRDDLDTLAQGFTDAQNTQATVTVTASATVTGSGTRTQTISMTIPTSTSWVLVDKLATFQVLGQDFANVVEVQTTTLVTDPVAGAIDQGNATIWLAKGIGPIRQEQTGTTLSTSSPLTTELVSTNLVAP